MLVNPGNGTPEQLAKQNKRERLHYRGRGAFQKIGNANSDDGRLQPDGAIGIGERAKLHFKSRRAGPRLELAENPGVNFGRALEKQQALKAFERLYGGRGLRVVLHFSRI